MQNHADEDRGFNQTISLDYLILEMIRNGIIDLNKKSESVESVLSRNICL